MRRRSMIGALALGLAAGVLGEASAQSVGIKVAAVDFVPAWGDLEGTGIWSFEADGDWTCVTYVWIVQVRKPLVRILSFLFKPIFSANHRWAMARGQESLVRELTASAGRTHQPYTIS